jgi:DNA-binding XRE family transcriptional regulator
LRFRHLDYAPGTPVASLGPAAVEALLDRGDLDDWKPLAHEIARDPWGETAETVHRLCDAHPMYGTSSLWRSWIDQLRDREDETRLHSLPEIRAKAGLTQTEVAKRLGISQADVSKLERRRDTRLSTLRAYARALGATLSVTFRWPGGSKSMTLRPPRDDAEPAG